MKSLVNSALLRSSLQRLPRVSFPMLGIDATINGVITIIGRAVCLAYIEPFTVDRRPPISFTVFDLDGRDPNW